MSLVDLFLGRPLATHEEGEQRVGPVAGIPMLGLDALASAAYGPEAALTILIPLSALGVGYIWPISIVIIALLLIVYVSYYQTIGAYPGGGGSYTVARSNLGVFAGLLAAAALLLDYILVVAIGISAGVGALVSALPVLQPYTLLLCLVILALIALINLRGVREAGLAFVLPTYLFVACLVIVIVIGLVKTALSGGHPVPANPLPTLPPATIAASLWLLLHAFSSGCTAMTGVEAVSNGVTAFREPTVVYARQTLTAIIGILAVLLAGIAYLVRAYGIAATAPGQAGYQSVLSQLTGAIVGKGIFYYITIAAVLAVLALSANTGFADFPRLCRIIARDDFLPHVFAERGRRLVFSIGIYVLAGLAGGLLILFGGVTDRLIPLFAVGAFLAFTLSQAGMVMYWWHNKGPRSIYKLFINGVGALATALTLGVVLVAKFTEGAWITLFFIPALLLLFLAVHRHYRQVKHEINCITPLDVENLRHPLIIVPVREWNMLAQKGLRFALKLSPDVYAVQILVQEDVDDLAARWSELVEAPTKAAGLSTPQLVTIQSPYRSLFAPLLKYILQMHKQYPDRQIAVIIPELVEHHWYHYFLHNQRASVLKALLLLRGDQRIVVINVPWYLST